MSRHASLTRRIALRALAAFALATVLLLALWWAAGRRALDREHEASSLRMAALFEASLQQAMLRRDLPGLERVLEHLGGMRGVSAAALLNPRGEVRFASAPVRVGRNEASALAGLCLTSGCGEVSAPRLVWRDGGSRDAGAPAAGTGDPQTQARALRVAYPIRNAERCNACHGATALQPVNGVLLLDLAPLDGDRLALQRASAWMLPAAFGALAVLGLGLAWVLRREVLRPVAALSMQVDRLSGGDLGARSALGGHDELARLGHGFDALAARVQQQMAALTTQHAFLQRLLDAAPDPMLVIGADHRIVLANAAYATLMQRPLAQIAGTPCHHASRARGEPCPATLVTCPLVACRERPEPLRTVMAFTRADGSAIDVEIHAAPLVAADGERQVVEVIRPLEEQVRFSQEQRLSAVGLLANGVAHEIHNPLASIRLALQASQRGLADGSMAHDELSEYLRLVDEQIDRCVHITQRLLRLSEPSAETAQPVEVADAIDDVQALLREEARQARVALVVRLAEPRLRVLGDAGELRQILVNLVQNAVHAMPDGGTLEIAAERMSDDAPHAHAGLVRLTVADSGCGIPSDRLPLIFLPFYSLRADGRRGTGMGLAICKSLVEQRGGRIGAAARTDGPGTVVTVTLPDADRAEADRATSSREEVDRTTPNRAEAGRAAARPHATAPQKAAGPSP